MNQSLFHWFILLQPVPASLIQKGANRYYSGGLSDRTFPVFVNEYSDGRFGRMGKALGVGAIG